MRYFSKLFLCPVTIALLFFTNVAHGAPIYLADNVSSPKGGGKPHGSSIVELENGDLLATWFSTEDETSRDTNIYGANWNRETGKWSVPRVIVGAGYAKSIGNTTLFRDDDGIIWLFFAAVQIGGWSGAMVDYVQSHDGGKTWGDGKRFVGWPGNLPRNIPIKIGDHEALVPLFIDFWYEVGLTGSYTAKIKYKDGEVLSKEYASLEGADPIQPTIVKLPNGKILLLARDKGKKFIHKAYSDDNGDSWSKPEHTRLPNPDAAISAIFVEEVNSVLLVYNHSNEGRNPLSLAVSGDGGKSFRRVADIAYYPEDIKITFSYPTLLRTSDGMIHAIWSHSGRATLKHVRFNVDWLKQVMDKPVLGETEVSRP